MSKFILSNKTSFWYFWWISLEKTSVNFFWKHKGIVPTVISNTYLTFNIYVPHTLLGITKIFVVCTCLKLVFSQPAFVSILKCFSFYRKYILINCVYRQSCDLFSCCWQHPVYYKIRKQNISIYPWSLKGFCFR